MSHLCTSSLKEQYSLASTDLLASLPQTSCLLLYGCLQYVDMVRLSECITWDSDTPRMARFVTCMTSHRTANPALLLSREGQQKLGGILLAQGKVSI